MEVGGRIAVAQLMQRLQDQPSFLLTLPKSESILSCHGAVADGFCWRRRIGWRKMATPVHRENGARSVGNLLGLVAVLLLTSGCGPKAQSTLPPALPPVQTTPQVVVDTVDVPPVDTTGTVEQLPLQSGWIYKALVNARSGPSTNDPIVTKLTRGDEVKLVEKADSWWKVRLSDSSVAYVHESLVSPERYVDPWTQFKMGGRLADTTLQIITAVTELKDNSVPSAALTVSDDWASFSKIRKQRVAQAALAYWKMCLAKAGYDPKGTMVILRDEEGVDLAKVTASADKTTVDFLK